MRQLPALLALVSLCAGAFAAPGLEMTHLDIRDVVNRGHDSQPYYDGETAAYTWLAPGDRVVQPPGGPVPFRVIDPNGNDGRSVMVTRGAKNDFPRSFHVFTYRRGVEAVYVLGLAAGWGRSLPEGTRVGRLVFRFGESKQVEVPLRVGLEVDDWTSHTATRAACALSQRAQGRGQHLDVLAMDLAEHRDLMLRSIEICGDTTRVSIPVFAITIAHRAGAATDRVQAAAEDLRSSLDQLVAMGKAVAGRGFAETARATADPVAARARRALAGPFRDTVRAHREVLRAKQELAPWLNKRAFAKVPDPHKPTFPDASDYMIVLERFPLFAERGWHGNYRDDPTLGYFGGGGHKENSLRTLGNFIFTYSLLASDPAYDPAVSGVDRALVLSHAKAALRYMTRSHVTGDIPCASGEPWGKHWQSAWWTSKMVAGARLIWDRLTPEEQAGVVRVLVYEADRHLPRKAPGREYGNTRSEENAWDSEVLAWAACLCPDHAHAKAWDAKAKEFFMNTLSVQADAEDGTVVDGKPVRQWVHTANLHPDFTIENHGAYQFCYMACPLHSLAWAYYAYTSTGRRPPQSLFHHYRDVWRVVRGTYLYDGRFAYLGGKDWARYVYGLYFIMPALVVMQNEFGDRDARMMEAARLRTFEWEQRQHADGGMFTGRYTHNVMHGWPSEYETDAVALLGLCHRLHAGRRLLPPADPADFQARAAGAMRSERSEWAFARGPGMFASFSWRMLRKGYSMGLFVPAGGDHMVEWGRNNLIGSFSVSGFDMGKRTVKHHEQMGSDHFVTTGVIGWGRRGEDRAIDQHLCFVAMPDRHMAVLFDLSTAASHVTVAKQAGLGYHLANDMFNGNVRRFQWEGGQAELQGVGGERADLRGESRWLNVDGRLGIVSLGTPRFGVRDFQARNAPWQSILYELIHVPQIDEPRSFRSGQTVRDECYLLLAADGPTTRRCAQESRVLPTDAPLSRAAYCRPAVGQPVVIVANFAASEQRIRVQHPGGAKEHVVPGMSALVLAAGR